MINRKTIKGAERDAEGSDLVGFLTELFTGWVGADSDVSISTSAAYRVGPHRTNAKYPRDTIAKFPYWVTKSKILESYWEHQK